jgi:putative transposase
MKNIEYKLTHYPSDLTDKQWKKISEFFPVGNKSTVHKRSLVEAVLYIVKTGCQWRLLPHDYPKWSTVKSFYYRAIAKGIWERVMQSLVEETRINAGRSETPSYALIDSQSVKTTADANNRGYDGGKKRKDASAIL